MLTAFRWLLRIFVAMAVLTVAALLLVYYFAARSLPEYSGDYEVEGISAPLEIVRDTADVPHIFGATDEDVFYALGFAHAEDRLWQMTILRRTVQGRLSEVFGTETVRTDELMRRLDLYGLAARSVAAQDPDVQRALEAYAKGVNAWIGIVNSQAKGRGAPEFFLFNNEISYWQPADSLAILKLMAFNASTQISTEVLRARLSLLDTGWAEDLMPEISGPGTAALPPYASLVPDVPKSFAALGREILPFLPRMEAPFGGASNAWAAAPSRSAAGGALLANDPHVDLSAPSLWYLARLELTSGGVIGATIPGVPAVLAGRNADLGWGITTAWADDQDIKLEELNPADATRYRAPEGWKPFVTRKSISTVRDDQPITVTLR